MRLFKNLFLLIIFLVFSRIPLAADRNPTLLVDKEGVETVFDWSQHKCFDENIPDSPARAFRSSGGHVYLYATHYKNIPFIGQSLDKVEPACNNVYSAPMDPAPDNYNARIWLQSFYAEKNGEVVYSLGSSDYHASWFGKCPNINSKNKGCWWSAIVLAKSNDGGSTFKIAPPPQHIIARSPQFFSPDSGGPTGFFTTSNIHKKEGYYYSFFNFIANNGKFRGNCLARTAELDEPSSWRAWDGKSFSKVFYTSPNQQSYNSQDYCKPIESLPYKIRSLVWHEQSKKYLAVFEEVKINPHDKNKVSVNFNYSWSENLIDWTKSETIMSIDSPSSCNHAQAIAAYPSLIDSESKDLNFGTVGNQAYLYYTQFNLSDGCRLTLDRDLVRVPVSIHQ